MLLFRKGESGLCPKKGVLHLCTEERDDHFQKLIDASHNRV